LPRPGFSFRACAASYHPGLGSNDNLIVFELDYRSMVTV